MKAKAWIRGAGIASVTLLLIQIVLVSCKTHQTQTSVWTLDRILGRSGTPHTLLGSPKLIREQQPISIAFDGIDDALLLPSNPIQGNKEFTIEVLMKPVASKSTEPRILHIQDSENNRVTIELRLRPDNTWYLDTFLKNGKTNKGLTLIDTAKLHALNKWYWLALRYDGRTMTSFVNGIQELSGEVEVPPYLSGETSLGMRLNERYFFEGNIAECRFHKRAVETSLLQRINDKL